MKVRLIIQRNIEDGTSEYVIFTKDFSSDVSTWLYPDHVADCDRIIDMEEILDFPYEFTLKRV